MQTSSIIPSRLPSSEIGQKGRVENVRHHRDTKHLKEKSNQKLLRISLKNQPKLLKNQPKYLKNKPKFLNNSLRSSFFPHEPAAVGLDLCPPGKKSVSIKSNSFGSILKLEQRWELIKEERKTLKLYFFSWSRSWLPTFFFSYSRLCFLSSFLG